MLKKVVISVFVSLVLVAPMTASATGNESAGDMKSSLSVEKSIFNEGFSVQVASDNVSNQKNAAPLSQTAVDESEPILPTGWLLTMALLGFVMLSNRSGV
ncbi:MAG: hypothetical protein V9E92_02370 [Methylotenera sp.]